MDQYNAIGKDILTKGVWVENKRTKTRCLTLLNRTMTYDVGAEEVPVLTGRRVPYIGGIGEFVGYLQGKTSAAEFRELGAKTWDKNANENEAWLNNPNRKGTDDMGLVYGAQARNWTNRHGKEFDLLRQVYDNLKKGYDSRGEIVTFWNPGEFEYGCLRPCMHTHQFSILDDRLYLTSISRKQHCAF